MKNQKGFTLVELLAVIIVVAIVALVVVPITMDVISKAKEKSAIESFKNYMDAVEKTIMRNNLKQESELPNRDSQGCYLVDELNDYIKMKGKMPIPDDDDDKVCIKNGKIESISEVIVDGYRIEYKNGEVKSNGKNTSIQVENIKITNSNKTIYIGKTLRLNIEVEPKESDISKLKWRSDNTSVATVDEDGIVTGISKGTAVITVRTRSGKEANITIKVRKEPTSIEITNSENRLYIEKPIQLNTKIEPEGTEESLTWTSSNPLVAIVSDTGLVTGLTSGNVTITVETESGKTASKDLIVKKEPQGIEITNTETNVYEEETMQLTTTLTPNDTNAELTWTSSNPLVAIVSESGIVTGLTHGTTIITVETENGKQAEIEIIVRIKPTSIEITNNETLVYIGSTLQLNTTIQPAGADNRVTWSSSDTSKATVSGSGVVTGVSKGNVTITAKTANGKEAIKTLTVKREPTEVSITTSASSMYIGYTLQLSTSLTPSDADTSLIWTSSSPTVATVSESGLVTALTSGSTTITVTTENGKTATKTLTIKPFTVSYNANGGSNAPSSQTKVKGATLTLANTVPYRVGYNFQGWSTSSSGSVVYQPGGSYTSDADITLYAVWASAPTISPDNDTKTTPSLKAGQIYYYKFVPSKTATYRFYGMLTSSGDNYGYLYNSSGSMLKSDDDGGSSLTGYSRNFLINYSMTAGTTYYLGIKWYSSSTTGSIPFKFTYNCDEMAVNESKTFNYTGSSQTFEMCPDNSYRIEAYGAQGANGGGYGAKAQGTFTSSSSGQKLYVVVGGQGGEYSGGYNGGGNSISGGGGASHVATVSSQLSSRASDYTSTVLIVAGGGGGKGIAKGLTSAWTSSITAAGNGGQNGTAGTTASANNGTYVYAYGGAGGTQSAAGACSSSTASYSYNHTNSSIADATNLVIDFGAPGGGGGLYGGAAGSIAWGANERNRDYVNWVNSATGGDWCDSNRLASFGTGGMGVWFSVPASGHTTWTNHYWASLAISGAGGGSSYVNTSIFSGKSASYTAGARSGNGQIIITRTS